MKISTIKQYTSKSDVLFLVQFENEYFEDLSQELGIEIKSSIKEKRYIEKFGNVQEFFISDLPYERVCIINAGKISEMSFEKVRRIIGLMYKKVSSLKYKKIETNLADGLHELNHFNLGKAIAESLQLVSYKFDKHLSKKSFKPENLSLLWTYSLKNLSQGLKVGKIIGSNTNLVRDLVNEPANIINSKSLEKICLKLSSKLKIKVLNKNELIKEKMGSLLSVNQGSANPAKLICLEYMPVKGPVTCLVGKGITFDTGGYNLKPTGYIETMHTDMGGAASVIGTLKTMADLGVKKNVVGIVPLCENMISSEATRPGDIVKASNGLTVKVGNTDAEGRLILADALVYAEKTYKPKVMIDLATLTGACVVALGYYSSGLLSKDDDLANELFEAGESSGDRAWRLPLYDDYDDWMDGKESDLVNISQKGKGREAGTITAAVFLSKFVKKARWAHLDIAGSSYWGIEGPYLSKGATGSAVRLLTEYLTKK